MQLYNQALVRNRKVTRSLDPLSLAWELWVKEGGRKKKKAEEAPRRKSAQTVILKDKKVVGRSTPFPASPVLLHTLDRYLKL